MVRDLANGNSVFDVDQIGGTSTAHASWRDSPSVCALADDHRHLGHIVKAGDYWLAFDATHINGTGSGFRLIGSWTNIAIAKSAVELAIAKDFDCISRLQ
jgi:hypothetical protein